MDGTGRLIVNGPGTVLLAGTEPTVNRGGLEVGPGASVIAASSPGVVVTPARPTSSWARGVGHV